MPPLPNRHRSGRYGMAWLLVLGLSAGVALGQDETRARRLGGSEIRDQAGMFSAGVIRRALDTMRQIELRSNIPIIIETIESLEGRSIDEEAQRRFAQLESKGVYLLVAKKEHKISDPMLPQPLADRLTREQRLMIRDAFIPDFKQGKFNEGLRHALLTISQVLASARIEGVGREPTPLPVPPPEDAPPRGASPLILQNQVRLTLAGARKIVAGAEEKAAAMGIKANIAVVDDGGHLLTFTRMDGGRPASVYTAITKATTAATFRQATGPVPAGTTAPDLLLNLSLQNAAAASGGKITTLYGGVPVVVDGQVIGGVGVGGGSGEQDTEIAKAGIAAFLTELEAGPKAEQSERRRFDVLRPAAPAHLPAPQAKPDNDEEAPKPSNEEQAPKL
jgi:glc operon protein GlcG